MRILIMGLPGSGKTTLANAVADALRKRRQPVTVIGADDIRSRANDWDFSEAGRIRQARRINDAASDASTSIVILDFVAALPEQRDIVRPDIVVWMNTGQGCRFKDTEAAFVDPMFFDLTFDVLAPVNISYVLEAVCGVTV